MSKHPKNLSTKTVVEPLPLYINAEDACQLLGVSRRTLAKYRAIGLPMHGHGIYNCGAIVAWYGQNEAHKAIKISAVKRPTAISNEKRLVQARADKIEMENAEKRNELLPFEEVKALFLFLSTLVANSFESLAPRLANILASMEDQAEIQAEIMKEARVTRKMMADKLNRANMKTLSEYVV